MYDFFGLLNRITMLFFQSSDEFAILAEEKSDFTWLAKSNAMRKRAAEKKNEVSGIDEQIKKLKTDVE